MTKEEAAHLCAEIDNYAKRAKEKVMSLITPTKKDDRTCFVSDTPCKKCGSYKMYTRHNGPHIGLYCQCCESWQKWVKDETPVVKQDAVITSDNTTDADDAPPW